MKTHRIAHLPRRMLLSLSMLAMVVVAWPQSQAAAVPKPTPYPVSWELRFDHQHPKRIVMESRGDKGAAGVLVHDLHREEPQQGRAEVLPDV